MFRAICAELADLQNGSQPDANSDPADLISSLKRTLRGFPDDTTVTILIEEIPLALGQEFNIFIEFILMAMLAIEADTNLNGRFQFAFSTLNDPTHQLGNGMGKLRERMQFLQMKSWTAPELRSLVDLIASVTEPAMTDSQRHEMALAAKGLPRYVKMVFRQLRNGASRSDFSSLLKLVATEQV